MKKIIILIISSTISLFASIGTINSIKGEAKILRANELLDAELDMEIEKKDIISTKTDSSIRIVLNDDTIVTIGKDSTLNIEEFIFDEKKTENSMTDLNFVKGAFHTITGKIGKINPSKFKLKTKSASIGIRGTEIFANENKVACTSGMIEVTSFGKINLVSSGNYIETFFDKIPTEVKQLDEKVLNEFKNSLNNDFETDKNKKNNKESKNNTVKNNTDLVEKNKIILKKTILVVDEGSTSKSGTLKAISTSSSLNFTYTTKSNIDGFTLNSDGTYIFDPSNPKYESLKRGETKVISIPITVKDEFGLSTTSLIKITVIGNTDLKGKHLGATSSSLEVDNLTSSMNVYDDKLVLNEYSPVKSVELSYKNFKNSYSSHSNIGTVSFTQNINSNPYTGSYIIHSDDMGEFVVGYSDSTYKSLFYNGLKSSKSVLDNSKIYTYKVYKGLNVNYSDDGSTLSSVDLNNSTTKLIKVNTKTGSVFLVDTSEKIENSGFKFDLIRLKSDGSLEGTSYRVIEDSVTSTVKDNKMTISDGQLYGSSGQGIGLTADLEYYSDSLTTNTTTTVDKSSKIIDSYYLDNNATKSYNSLGNLSFEGLSTAIYTGENISNTKSANKINFDINKNDGTFSNGKISFLTDRTNSTYTDIFSMNNIGDGVTSYFINEDNFGVKINNYIPSDGNSLVSNSSWLVAISDKVNADGTFSENLDNESSWGYWTSNIKDTSSNIQNISAYSTWVSGTKTDVNYVRNLINSSTITTLNFKGNMIGAIQDGTTLDAVKLDNNNITNLSFSLGSSNGSFSGDFKFKTLSEKSWSGNFSGTATSSGFNGTSFTNLNINNNSISTGYSGNIDGNYYGTNEIKSVGGSININNTGNGNLVGSFKADKN